MGTDLGNNDWKYCLSSIITIHIAKLTRIQGYKNIKYAKQKVKMTLCIYQNKFLIKKIVQKF